MRRDDKERTRGEKEERGDRVENGKTHTTGGRVSGHAQSGVVEWADQKIQSCALLLWGGDNGLVQCNGGPAQ